MRSPFQLLLAVLSLCALLACELGEPLENPEDVPIDAIITLNRVATGPLRVNAVDTLDAQIPAGSSETSITFSTTAGTFLESADKSLVVRAARNTATAEKLTARAFLRAPADTATVFVRATVKSFYAAVTIPVVK